MLEREERRRVKHKNPALCGTDGRRRTDGRGRTNARRPSSYLTVSGRPSCGLSGGALERSVGRSVGQPAASKNAAFCLFGSCTYSIAQYVVRGRRTKSAKLTERASSNFRTFNVYGRGRVSRNLFATHLRRWQLILPHRSDLRRANI